jgi:hypothetical protein
VFLILGGGKKTAVLAYNSVGLEGIVVGPFQQTKIPFTHYTSFEKIPYWQLHV